MAYNLKKSEERALQTYGVALDNSGTNEKIFKQLNLLGYNVEVLQNGKNLLEKANKKYQLNKREGAIRSKSFDLFEELWDEMDKIYMLHRKMARVVFRKEPAILLKLEIQEDAPASYEKWIQVVKTLYRETALDDEIQQKLSRLNFSIDDVKNAEIKIEALSKARTTYMNEKGESQQATLAKDKAFDEINEWMSDFYAVARIALEDQPQLLESLNKVVN